MNFAEISTLARIYMDETTAAYWTAAQLNNVINQSIRHVANIACETDTSLKHGMYEVAFPADVESIVLPVTVKKVLTVERRTTAVSSSNPPSTVEPMEWNERHSFYVRAGSLTVSTTSERVPYRFAIQGDRLWLAPIPDSAITLRIHHWIRETSLEDGMETPLPNLGDHHELIAIEAARRAMVKEGKINEALERVHAEVLAAFKRSLTARQVMRPRHVINREEAPYY